MTGDCPDDPVPGSGLDDVVCVFDGGDAELDAVLADPDPEPELDPEGGRGEVWTGAGVFGMDVAFGLDVAGGELTTVVGELVGAAAVRTTVERATSTRWVSLPPAVAIGLLEAPRRLTADLVARGACAISTAWIGWVVLLLQPALNSSAAAATATGASAAAAVSSRCRRIRTYREPGAGTGKTLGSGRSSCSRGSHCAARSRSAGSLLGLAGSGCEAAAAQAAGSQTAGSVRAVAVLCSLSSPTSHRLGPGSERVGALAGAGESATTGAGLGPRARIDLACARSDRSRSASDV